VPKHRARDTFDRAFSRQPARLTIQSLPVPLKAAFLSVVLSGSGLLSAGLFLLPPSMWQTGTTATAQSAPMSPPRIAVATQPAGRVTQAVRHAVASWRQAAQPPAVSARSGPAGPAAGSTPSTPARCGCPVAGTGAGDGTGAVSSTGAGGSTGAGDGSGAGDSTQATGTGAKAATLAAARKRAAPAAASWAAVAAAQWAAQTQQSTAAPQAPASQGQWPPEWPSAGEPVRAPGWQAGPGGPDDAGWGGHDWSNGTGRGWPVWQWPGWYGGR
jgi:hypothetical protein